MINSASAFFLGKTLILALSQPVFFSQSENEVWISKQEAIAAQRMNRGVQLYAKQKGSYFAFGIHKELLERVLVLEAKDYEALKICKNFSWDEEHFPLKLLKAPEKSFHSLEKCGFQELGLSTELQTEWTKEFQNQELNFISSGGDIQDLYWTDNGRRHAKLNSAKEVERFKQFVGVLAPFYETQLEGSTARPGRTLVFQLNLFEYSRNQAEALGVRWPQSVRLLNLNGGELPSAKNLQIGANGAEIGADFGESLGLTKVIAKPQIRTKPGEKASFQTGGEIPIQEGMGLAAHTQWKNYGLIVDLTPDGNVSTGANDIILQLRLELSEPDLSLAVHGTPGMKVRRLESRFDLKTDEETVLSTLLQTRWGDHSEGPWSFRYIPIFGRLFESKSSTDNNSELWLSIKARWDEIEKHAEF